MNIIDSNACGNCRRPIQKLAGIGWVHGELAQYASEESTCENPRPVDPRCPFCGFLVPASSTSGAVLLSRHTGGSPVVCIGSGTIQEIPT